MFKHLLFFLFLIGSCYYYWTTRPVTHGPGIVVSTAPVQQRAFGIDPIEYKSYTLTPVAEFNIKARVLSKKRYSDYRAEIIPYDFVVSWGPMSDERNLDNILVRQSDRSFYWEMTSPPIPEYEMLHHTANMHLIPSTNVIRNKLGNVRRGHIISIKGYLVNIASSNGWQIKSSTSRSDIGDKASEVVWIEEFTILQMGEISPIL